MDPKWSIRVARQYWDADVFRCSFNIFCDDDFVGSINADWDDDLLEVDVDERLENWCLSFEGADRVQMCKEVHIVTKWIMERLASELGHQHETRH